MGMRSTRRRALTGFTAASAAVVLALAGCGNGDDNNNDNDNGDTPTIEADPDLAELVPDDIAADGQLSVGVDATYPPNEYLAEDGQTVEGFDVDLFDAVAAKLGLTVEWSPAPFGAIIPGVESGEYEVGVSSFTINEERLTEVDMVSYFNAGTQWAAPAGEPVDPDNACGLRIAVQRDTVQVDDITERSEQCEADGESAITIEQFQGQDLATASVVSGQNDAMLADSPVSAYAVAQTDGALELVGEIYDAAPYGYVVNQDQSQLAEALQAGLQAIIDDGTYLDILTEWGVEGGAIDDPAVNP
ncbi:ABC transporter substrate-binding protein [Natronosporangium hydrolyticum]|uniref:ABC transporter substrate-binding protein n=1 Tax=Natronosporangium hydrolyticum TaxID=2811111 RepID=A0A895YIV1_9ACTN|nr:ABC transporter substrate-binding protein [Natronosporangium hydrolyticum]QSB13698.1 ABC transporter substrate-binding protein [Natronosporangium hydrolyticum]